MCWPKSSGREGFQPYPLPLTAPTLWLPISFALDGITSFSVKPLKLISNLGNFSINLSVFYLLDTLYAGCFRLRYKTNEELKIRFSKESEFRTSDNPILREEP